MTEAEQGEALQRLERHVSGALAAVAELRRGGARLIVRELRASGALASIRNLRVFVRERARRT